MQRNPNPNNSTGVVGYLLIFYFYMATFFSYVSRLIFRTQDQRENPQHHKKDDDVETHSDDVKLEEETSHDSSIQSSSEHISTKKVLSSYADLVLAKENRPRILVASGLTTLSTALNFLAPYLLGTVINSIGQKKDNEDIPDDFDSYLWNIACLVVVYSMAQVIPNIRDQILVPVSAHNTEKILNQITRHQLNESLDYHINTPYSDQVYFVQKGFAVASIGTPLLTQVAPTLFESFIATAALTYQYGPAMGIGISTVLASYLAYSAKTTQPIIDCRENFLKKGSASWNSINNAIKQYKTIHDFKKLSETLEKVELATASAAEAEALATTTPLQIGVGHIAIPRVGMIAAMLYLGMRAQSGQFTIPEFIALFGYFNQLSASIPAVGSALNQIFASYPDLKFVFGKLAKISPILDEHPENPLRVNGAASIRVEDVSFNYAGKPSTFNHLSLEIAPGQTVAIVSESGGGKSTLFNLLYGYYTPISGNIFVNEQNISEISRISLQDNICLIGQNPNLFNGSIRDNIKFGARNPDEISDERIYELAESLNLVGFICSLAKEKEVNFESFKKGLEISAGEEGKALSGGQQQKVAILRGFINGHVPIRCLDEITAALDAESASAVLEGIKKLSGDTTTLVITHHLAEVTSADKIFVLDQGSLIAQGTHEELLDHCSVYRNLWMKQNQTQEDVSVTSHSGLFSKKGKEKIKDTVEPQYHTKLGNSKDSQS